MKYILGSQILYSLNPARSTVWMKNCRHMRSGEGNEEWGKMCIPRRENIMFESPELNKNVVCLRNQRNPTQHRDERQALTSR